jgi:hypothetical protein
MATGEPDGLTDWIMQDSSSFGNAASRASDIMLLGARLWEYRLQEYMYARTGFVIESVTMPILRRGRRIEHQILQSTK